MTDNEAPEDEDVMDPHSETMTRLTEWAKRLDGHWGDWVKETRESFRFTAGDQYEDTTERELKDGGKIPVTFNRVGPIIDAVVGAEIQGRQQTQYFPRETGDARINEILTQGAEWIRDLTDADGEETDQRRDAFICGIGWVSTEMDYEIDPDGRILMSREDPTEVLVDPDATKACVTDKRYLRHRKQISKDAFEDLYGDIDGVFDPSDGDIATHNSDPRDAYETDDREKRDMVTVDHWQWYETETVIMAPSQDGAKLVEYSPEDFEKLEAAGAESGYKIEGQRRRRRKYYAATVTGKIWLVEPKPIPMNKFTYCATTGKRDNEKGVWYGLVRPMKDPQKWANAFFSMLLHMVRTNAKGGIMAEEGALGDRKRFEESFAKSDEITVVADGAISQKRVMPKPQPQYPAGIDRLMEQAIVAIRETSGISPEMLGMADREQAGVLEAQRKQTAYGLLSTFFEGFRRYRKEQGELLLDFMPLLGPDTLVRVTLSTDELKNMQEQSVQQAQQMGAPVEAGPTPEMEQQKYVKLAMALDSRKYDVVVDESPAGPNQRERTWLMFMQLLPAVGDRMSPEMWAEALKYSPLPDSFSSKMREMIMSMGQDEQAEMMERMNQAMMGEELRGKQAQNRKTNAEATGREVETAIAMSNPDPSPQTVM